MATISYSTALIFLLMVGLAFYFSMKLGAMERRLLSLHRLEAKLDLLLKQDGIAYEPFGRLPTDVANALQSGEKIRAVSLYASMQGCTLREAKEVIEKVEREHLSPQAIKTARW
jgi:hypothetical protein